MTTTRSQRRTARSRIAARVQDRGHVSVRGVSSGQRLERKRARARRLVGSRMRGSAASDGEV